MISWFFSPRHHHTIIGECKEWLPDGHKHTGNITPMYATYYNIHTPKLTVSHTKPHTWLNACSLCFVYSTLVLKNGDIVWFEVECPMCTVYYSLKANTCSIIQSYSSPPTQYADMLDSVKWLSVKQICDLHTAKLVYQIENELAPPYLTGLLHNDTSEHNYETSSAHGHLSVPNAHWKAKQRTFQFNRCSNIRTDLPSRVRNAPSLYSLRSACTTFIAQH